jgi:hypothetical protein|tara:strand:+ start:9386 stop:9901 length:516 start_codon:yes stop_codon:yes gene_type:complete
MNKKGQQSFAIVGFLLLGLTIVFITYLIAVPMAKVWDDVSVELKDEDAFGSDNKSVEAIEDMDDFITPAFDQLVTIGFFGLILTLLITSIFFRDHPIFIVFLAIGFIIIIIIGSQLVNVADEAMNDQILNSTVEDFTYSSLIFSSALPAILLVAGFVAIIIIMSRRTGFTA